MVVIRLARHGAKKAPVYRVVATDSRNGRDGRFIEILGTYNPTGANKGSTLKLDRIGHWLGLGAQPSDTVSRLLRAAQKADAAAAAE